MNIDSEANEWIGAIPEHQLNSHEKEGISIMMAMRIELDRLTSELASVREERNVLKAQIATLETLVPHPGDGSCYVCGSSPAHDVPMCEGCCDDFAIINDIAAEVCDHSVDPNDMVCEWVLAPGTLCTYRTSCDRTMLTNGMDEEDEGEECCNCGRPIKVKG